MLSAESRSFGGQQQYSKEAIGSDGFLAFTLPGVITVLREKGAVGGVLSHICGIVGSRNLFNLFWMDKTSSFAMFLK